jgi:hypothetical protein
MLYDPLLYDPMLLIDPYDPMLLIDPYDPMLLIDPYDPMLLIDPYDPMLFNRPIFKDQNYQYSQSTSSLTQSIVSLYGTTPLIISYFPLY